MKLYYRQFNETESSYCQATGMDKETVERLASELGFSCEFVSEDEYCAAVALQGKGN